MLFGSLLGQALNWELLLLTEPGEVINVTKKPLLALPTLELDTIRWLGP